jgi:GNAT superfamily N-acetyltransferase
VNQHVPLPPRPPSRSGRAPPRKLTYTWEPFSQIIREVAPLFVEHWRELALNQDDIPLDPDYDRYLAYEQAGILHVLTARTPEHGRLVGYAFCLLGPHLHYASTRFAHFDMFWLAPKYRAGWHGIRLIRNAERRMADLGAKIMTGAVKQHFADGRVGALFEFLGYSPIETNFAKRIG